MLWCIWVLGNFIVGFIQATRGHRPAMTSGRPKADPGWLFKKIRMGSDRDWVINSNKHIKWSKKEGYSTYTTLQISTVIYQKGRRLFFVWSYHRFSATLVAPWFLKETYMLDPLWIQFFVLYKIDGWVQIDLSTPSALKLVFCEPRSR